MSKEVKYVQGDVVLIKINSLPKGLEKQELESRYNRVVLQESEVTGHHHHFMPDADVEVYRDPADMFNNKTVTVDTNRYLVINAKTTKLYHGKGFEENPAENRTGDHKAMPVPPGIYKINIVQVYDYDLEERVLVRD
jgi:hypothetical protein